MLKNLKGKTALYLYHARRYCVSIEKADESDVSLFDATNDASEYMYDHQAKDYKFYDTIEGAIYQIRELLFPTGKNDYPYRILKIK